MVLNINLRYESTQRNKIMIDVYIDIDDHTLIGYDDYDRPIYSHPRILKITSEEWIQSIEGMMMSIKNIHLAKEYCKYLDGFMLDFESEGTMLMSGEITNLSFEDWLVCEKYGENETNLSK